MCTINKDHIIYIYIYIYGSGNVRCDTKSFNFGLFFALLATWQSRKSKFWKTEWRKCLKMLSIYKQICTINDNHMMYGSWDLECNRQNFLSFWTVFALLPPNNPKSKILKKWKKLLEILFTYVYYKWKSYDKWFLKYVAQHTKFLLFWTIFCPFTPLTNQKIKIL